MTGATALMAMAAVRAELAHRRVTAGLVLTRWMQVHVLADAFIAVLLALSFVMFP